MKIKYHLSLITSMIWILMVTNAQFDAHHKFFRKLYKPTIGQYQAVQDGRYHSIDDGSYRRGNEGRYMHESNQYIHDDRSDVRHSSAYSPVETHLANSTDDVKGYYQQNRLGFSFAKGNKNGDSRFSLSNTRTPVSHHTKSIRFHNASRNKARAKMHSTNDFRNTFQGFHYGQNRDSKQSKIHQFDSNKIQAGDSNNGKSLQKGDGTSEGRGDWAILHLEKEQNEDNSYHYRYETENGISVEELGQLEQMGSDVVLRSTGFYEYTGDDGRLYRVDYTADEDGFVAQGDHIPEQAH